MNSLPQTRRKSAPVLATLGIGLLLSLPVLAQPAEQSPVDISRSTTIRDPNPPHLVFNYGFSNVELRNTYGATDETTPARVLAQEWGTLKASLKTGLPGVMVNGVPYDLIQFHFHTPSEHTVNGRRTDMEIHFVHLIHDGGCASGKRPLFVIGVFIDAGGNSDRELQRLFPPGLPKKNTDDPVTVPGVDLRALLPAGSPTWRYDGGLTAPASDCTQFKPLSTQAVTGDFPEAVHWVVYDKAMHLPQNLVDRYRALFPGGDSRDVKALGTRKIYSLQRGDD